MDVARHIPDAILDQLLAGADPGTALEADGLLDGLKTALVERALNAEMDHHSASAGAGNSRNGDGRETVTTDSGLMDLAMQRDRLGWSRSERPVPSGSLDDAVSFDAIVAVNVALPSTHAKGLHHQNPGSNV